MINKQKAVDNVFDEMRSAISEARYSIPFGHVAVSIETSDVEMPGYIARIITITVEAA